MSIRRDMTILIGGIAFGVVAATLAVRALEKDTMRDEPVIDDSQLATCYFSPDGVDAGLEHAMSVLQPNEIERIKNQFILSNIKPAHTTLCSIFLSRVPLQSILDAPSLFLVISRDSCGCNTEVIKIARQ